jgi:DNA-binding NtrC family response regulator
LYHRDMSSAKLFTWIGNTDFRAARGELEGALGPIAQAVKDRRFATVHILSDHDQALTRQYVAWLKESGEVDVVIHPVKLSGPTRFGEIYEAAIQVLGSVQVPPKDGSHVAYHLSPGTPAMAAVWILLAKTTHPAELIESSAQEGVRTVSLPFEIAVEYLPTATAPPEDQILRLTQGLPPEVPEFGAIIHRCAAMKKLIAQARRVAEHDVPVLIQGESGTGKELFARAIHASGLRAGGPFVEVNCGAIPADLVEAEFFGHTKGAFTGAGEAREGLIESANGGTLFLDEIGELPLPSQVKLLRVLQQGTVQRVGGRKPVKVDFRVIVATNRNLRDEVATERFREDLFHRIAIGVLLLPPLRERPGDAGILIDFFLARINAECSQRAGWLHKKLSAGAKNLLLQHPWPGNVRELSNTLSRAAIWTTGDVIGTEEVRQALFPVGKQMAADDGVLNRNLDNGVDLPEVLAQVARHYLSRAYREAQGNKSAACKLVGLPNYQTFTNWMNKYGVES